MTDTSKPEAGPAAHGVRPADQASDDDGVHAGGAHGDDAHGHGEDSLGPINVAAWGAGLFGAIVGIVIAACFVLATSPG